MRTALSLAVLLVTASGLQAQQADQLSPAADVVMEVEAQPVPTVEVAPTTAPVTVRAEQVAPVEAAATVAAQPSRRAYYLILGALIAVGIILALS